jgi:hypothetical protein
MAEEELFDVIIPPGVPKTIIIEIMKKFEVQVVERKMPLYFANMDGTEREVLAFRGKREVVEKVEKYLKEELAKFIEGGGFFGRPEKSPEKQGS